MHERNQPLKILTREQFEIFRLQGIFAGSQDDRRDGFIHLCTPEQLDGTISRHFSEKGALVIVQLDTKRLGDALRMEPSRGGALFPHLYRALRLDDVVSHSPYA